MPDDQERWKRLCEQASIEQDPHKLLKLIEEINQLFAARESARNSKPHDSSMESQKAGF